jgi:hypothetical protein
MEKQTLIANSTPKEPEPYRAHALPITLVFLVLYSASDLSLPLYNKVLDNGFGSEKGFHYPATSATVQVGLVSLCLLIWCLIEHAFKKGGSNGQEQWIFSSFKGFLLKM